MEEVEEGEGMDMVGDGVMDGEGDGFDINEMNEFLDKAEKDEEVEIEQEEAAGKQHLDEKFDEDEEFVNDL